MHGKHSASATRGAPISLAATLTLAACAGSAEPIAARSERPPSAVELFRRARFRELAGTNSAAVGAIAASLYTRSTRDAARTADWDARASYRRGDPWNTRAHLSALPPENRTRLILEALLAHADGSAPLRRSSIDAGALVLPLEPQALDRGYPVLRVELEGQTHHLLWDTGATENVLGPHVLDALALARTEVQFVVPRGADALVVRATATATGELSIGPWLVRNIPWLVAELETVEKMRRELAALDGFLSPQLLLPRGCFAIDRVEAVLVIAFDPPTCRRLVETAHWKAPLYGFDGEVYASARVHHSPDVAVQVETGSPVTFLRSDASRYLPAGAIDGGASRPVDGEVIAQRMVQPVSIQIAGRERTVSAIDLLPRRQNAAYDDIATLGNDVLLQGRGVVVSFATMEIGTLRSSTRERLALSAAR